MNISGNQTLRPFIDNYITFISEKQQRLSDGTLSRNRPLPMHYGLMIST